MYLKNVKEKMKRKSKVIWEKLKSVVSYYFYTKMTSSSFNLELLIRLFFFSLLVGETEPWALSMQEKKQSMALKREPDYKSTHLS